MSRFNEYKLFHIEREKPYDYFFLIYKHENIGVEKVKIFLGAIFLTLENISSELPHKIFVIILSDIIGLENFLLSLRQS